jgi:hypothetical protein
MLLELVTEYWIYTEFHWGYDWSMRGACGNHSAQGQSLHCGLHKAINMPARRSEVSQPIAQFERIIRLAVSYEGRDWKTLEWPPSLERLAKTEFLAAKNRPLELQTRLEAQIALQLSTLAPLQKLVMDPSQPTLRISGLVVALQYGASLERRTPCLNNAQTVDTLCDLKSGSVKMLADRLEEMGWVPRALAYDDLALDVRQQLEGLFSDLQTTEFDLSFDQLKSAGLIAWYDAVCAYDREKNGPLPKDDKSILPVVRGRGMGESRASICARLGLIERPDLMAQLIAKAQACAQRNYPLIVYGQPGTGKTELLRLLTWLPDSPLPQTIVSIAQEEEALRLVNAARDWPAATEGNNAFFNRLRELIAGKVVLLVLDNVQDNDLTRDLLALPVAGSVIIAATHSRETAQRLSPTPDCLFSLPGFSFEDVELYYQTFINPQPEAADWQYVRQVWEKWEGNPLRIQIVLHFAQSRGWDHALKGNMEGSPRLFDSAYASLPPDLQHDFRRLGALPDLWAYDAETCAALWQASPDNASRSLDRLYREAGLVKPMAFDGQNQWTIPPEVRRFALDLLKRAPQDEQATAHAWMVRAEKAFFEKHPVAKVQAEAHNISRASTAALRKQWSQLSRNQEGTDKAGLIWPWVSVDWQLPQWLQPSFTSAEYVRGLCYQAFERRERIQWTGAWRILIFCSLIIFISVLVRPSMLIAEPTWLFGGFFAFLAFVIVFFTWYLADYDPNALWLELLLKVVQRSNGFDPSQK